jgi:hypothetical protein
VTADFPQMKATVKGLLPPELSPGGSSKS